MPPRCRCRDCAPPTRTSRPTRSSGGENLFSVVPAKAGTHTPRPLDVRRCGLILCETIAACGYGSPLSRGRRLEMREIMRECFDFLVAQGIGDVRHRRSGAAGSNAGFVVV